MRITTCRRKLVKLGLKVVVTGSAGESSLTRQMLGAMREPALDWTGKTTLGTLASLVERARLVVCNDIGISHVAAAVRTR